MHQLNGARRERLSRNAGACLGGLVAGTGLVLGFSDALSSYFSETSTYLDGLVSVLKAVSGIGLGVGTGLVTRCLARGLLQETYEHDEVEFAERHSSLADIVADGDFYFDADFSKLPKLDRDALRLDYILAAVEDGTPDSVLRAGQVATAVETVDAKNIADETLRAYVDDVPLDQLGEYEPMLSVKQRRILFDQYLLSGRVGNANNLVWGRSSSFTDRNGSSSPWLMRLGIGYFQMGDLRAAEQFYREANVPCGLKQVALAYREQGDEQEAVRVFASINGGELD